MTDLIRDSGFKVNDNKTTITEFIFQKLVANKYSPSDIDFETIIHVIEELIVFYSRFDRERETPSLQSCFFTSQFGKEIMNFSIKDNNARHGYGLQIPPGVDYVFSSSARHDETPEQFFLLHLLRELITSISVRVSEYSFHSTGHSVKNYESTISQSFCNWMKRCSVRNALRIYTLNYDELFCVLLRCAGLSVFDGFELEPNLTHGDYLRADVAKILSDQECNIHYNLHGSTNWTVLDLDQYQLPNPEIVTTGFLHLPTNSNPASFQMEKGNTILVTNIITGYQKVQRSSSTPFRQMHAAFDRDCCFGDKIYIIGYSFGDEHINQSLKTAIRHGVKMIIVDPDFINKKMDLKLALNLFPYRQEGGIEPCKIGNALFSYIEGQVIVHNVTFEDFLLEGRDNY